MAELTHIFIFIILYICIEWTNKEIKQLLTEFERLSAERDRLKQAIIIHTIETGQPINFLSDLDFSNIDFGKVEFGFGNTIDIRNEMSRTPITDLETLKKVYGK